MTSRERVLNALNFKEPDQIPLDLGGHLSSGISAIAYAKLKRALGITTGAIYVRDPVQQLALVEREVRDALHIDTEELGDAFMQPDDAWQDWTLPDGTPCKLQGDIKLSQKNGDWFYHNSVSGDPVFVQRKGCLYFETLHYPFADYELEDGVDPVLAYRESGKLGFGPSPVDSDALRRRARAFYRGTDRAVVGIFGGNLLETIEGLLGMDNCFVQMAAAPEAYAALVNGICDAHMKSLAQWLDDFGDAIDVILFGDDLGGQNAPLLSPAMYRRFFKPCQKRMWDYVHRRCPRLKINLHSCGAIEPLMNDLIEAGLDAVNPVQISCAGMDTAALKEKYRGRLTLWGGGCDTRRILPRGTPQMVGEHVREQCRMLAPDGGFIFQQVHNIQADVPPENILAMFAAARAR